MQTQTQSKGFDFNVKPVDRKGLKKWLAMAGLEFPDHATCPTHNSPLDYLCHSFFEESPADCVVWANRGGGKTFVGAVATLLDLRFKPGIQVRILAGSVEQAQKMFGYLSDLIQRIFPIQIAGAIGKRSFRLKNGSRVEVLAQSEKSVRGTRVHKLRCDEVELFSREIWNAAQLVTRSETVKRDLAAKPNVDAPTAQKHGRRKPAAKPAKPSKEPLKTQGAIEAFSTMHLPGGLMSEIIASARAAGKKVFAWCAWDVLRRCAPERPCDSCAILDGCRRRAKNAGGFLHVDDLIAMKSRVSLPVWENEVLCLSPKRDDAVFARFSRADHIRQLPPSTRFDTRRVLGVDFGYAGAFACVFIDIVGEGPAARVHVVGEFVRARAMLQANVDAVKDRATPRWPAAVHVDPAGVAVNPHTGISDVRLLRDAGFPVRFRRQRIEPGLQLVEQLLCPALGAPRLTIDPSCTHLIAALENYRWQTARGGAPLKDGVHDHILDALRYALTGELLPPSKTEVRQY